MGKLREIMVVVVFVFVSLPISIWAQAGGGSGEPVAVKFGEAFAEKYAITRGNKIYLCDGQQVGFKDGNPVAVLIYPGLPFNPSPLKVVGEVKEPLLIEIVGHDKDTLLPAKNSSIPVFYYFDPSSGKVASETFTQAVNVTWEFKKAGISFDTDDATYSSRKPGATIAFTKDGIKMKDIKKAPKTAKKK